MPCVIAAGSYKGRCKKYPFFLGLCPKLWVGGGQEPYTFGEVSDLNVYIVFWVIFSIFFFSESPKHARWVGGVRYLGQSPFFCFFEVSLITSEH